MMSLILLLVIQFAVAAATFARLRAVQQVIKNGLGVLGISAPDQM